MERLRTCDWDIFFESISSLKSFLTFKLNFWFLSAITAIPLFSIIALINSQSFDLHLIITFYRFHP